MWLLQLPEWVKGIGLLVVGLGPMIICLVWSDIQLARGRREYEAFFRRHPEMPRYVAKRQEEEE